MAAAEKLDGRGRRGDDSGADLDGAAESRLRIGLSAADRVGGGNRGESGMAVVA